MPVSVVVVHEKPKFVAEVAAELGRASYEVAAFTDPMAALDALEKMDRVEVLITLIRFANGDINGLGLAQLAKSCHPQIRVLFTAPAGFAAPEERLGEFLPEPVSAPHLVKVVKQLARPPRKGASPESS